MRFLGIAVLAAGFLNAGVSSAQDAASGEKLFRKCASCHQIGEGAQNRVGPILTGVIGRPAASVEGYKYSSSLQDAGAAGLVWDEEEVFAWLGDPKSYLRKRLDDKKAKTKMTFRLKKQDERRDVIAYLSTFSQPQEASLGQGICVRNDTQNRRFFAVEARESGERTTSELAPGGTLCSDPVSYGSIGIVSVFETADTLEGCSRLVQAGQEEALMRYADFDRCAWTSNS